MARAHIPVEVDRRVRAAAQNRCGYCLSPQHLVMARLEIEHIIPLSEGGNNEETNLWLACPLCNRYKGTLYSRETAQVQLDEAMATLQGSCWSKSKRLLSDPRALRHLDRLHEQLAEAVPEPVWRETLTHLWYLNRAMRQAEGAERVRLQVLVMLERVQCERLGVQWPSAYEEVDALLRQAVRTSRAVEGVNSVVRMHQGRHRHVSQGMLDLKRLYWNCRVFREGKRKGCCPYELLGIKLPTENWWELLQMSPTELEQKLSTQ